MSMLIVRNLYKSYQIGVHKNKTALFNLVNYFSGREEKKTIRVLRGLNMDARGGDIIGIIGDNGSGKSTFLRILAGIYKADKGKIEVKGNVISLIGLGIGLKERLSMRDNINLCGSLYNLSNSEVKKKQDAIVEFSGLKKFLDTKIYQFSRGMQQRLAFSIAINCNPSILLLDEPFENGDTIFKKKSMDEVKRLAAKGSIVIIAYHNTDLISKHCSKVYSISNGRMHLVTKRHIN